jgi:hypothetical protein
VLKQWIVKLDEAGKKGIVLYGNGRKPVRLVREPLIKPLFERARLYRLRKNSVRREAGVSTPAQSPQNQWGLHRLRKKVCFVTGHDFSRAANAIESTWAL